MASSAGNPNQPTPPFDMQKLFKPPSPNPNPNNIRTPNPSANPNPNFYAPPPHSAFSYPPPTPPFHHHPFLHYPQSPLPSNLNASPTPSPNPNPGARLMALLGNTPPSQLESAASMQPAPPPAIAASELPPVLQASPTAPPAPVARVASSKMPRGRFLGTGERAVYDVDSRLMGELVPPQLEVTPITKYVSDPGLVLGRQIAVNRTYISYGLKMGPIRILNINTALRSLLRGHSQKVSDMAFFAEDVHFLASASVDGKVVVWKIDEGPDEENKPQITGKIVLAVQLGGEGESYHPRICWHAHKQEVLIVAIGNCVLKIDISKVGRGKEFSADEPLKCPVEKLIDGIQLIGKHDGDVTDLSISQWMTTRLASASKDGTVKIWEDRKAVPLVTLRPHERQPVSSVAFLTCPRNPEHIVLITAGPLNTEVKLWTTTSEEGWLMSSDSETLRCTQTLELRSSAEPRLEEAFFNQVVALPRASLILLANAKKNTIYAVHVDYGPFPASTRMDYIADFTVTMPILSLTGTSDSPPDTDQAVQVVQIYCVQTQAIQQYALDLYQCLPPVDALLGRDSGIRVFDGSSSEGFAVLESSRAPIINSHPVGSASPKTSYLGSSLESVPTIVYPAASAPAEVSGIHEQATLNLEAKPSAPLSSSDAVAPNTVPSAPNMGPSGGLSILRNPPKGFERGPSVSDRDASEPVNYPVEGRGDTASTIMSDVSSTVDNLGKDESKAGINNNNLVPNSHILFKLGANTTHLVTPSEILSGAISSSDTAHVSQGLRNDEVKVQDVNNDMKKLHSEVKHVGESRLSQAEQSDPQKELQVSADNEKARKTLSSEPNNEIPREVSSLTPETSNVDKAPGEDDISVDNALGQPSVTGENEVQENTEDLSEKVTEAACTVPLATNGKKRKAKQSHASGPSTPSLSPFNSTDSLNEPGSVTGVPSTDAPFSQLQSMQHMLNQLVSMQKEMQKQMNSVVAGPINKEGKRVETALGRTMEKALKANIDALWVRIQEETAKHEKAEKDRVQQLTSVITNFVNKDMPAMLERALKKEISSVGPALARAVTPAIEKSISSAIADSFQRGIADKAVGQLEKSVNSKLETAVTRQIQAQFQTSGKHTLQEAVRSSLESSVIPAFEQSCKAMFEQVDTAFQKGMNEHTAAAQQHFESTHSSLAITLRDAINSASSITQNLTSELADGQRQILALVTGNTKALNPMAMQQPNGPMGGLPEALSLQQVEAPLDPTKELSRLISEHKFGEAFTMALQKSDVSIVSWLCSQVDLHAICSMVPIPLNQGVLLALLQQLACDISKDRSRKLGWMTDVALAINPTDPMITLHVRPIFEQVYNMLAHQRSLPPTTASEATSIRLTMHLINSVLMSCK